MAHKTSNTMVPSQGVSQNGKIQCKYGFWIGVKVGNEIRLLPNCSLGFDPRQARSNDPIMGAVLNHLASHSKPRADGFNWQEFEVFGRKFYFALVEKTPQVKMTAEEVDAAWG